MSTEEQELDAERAADDTFNERHHARFDARARAVLCGLTRALTEAGYRCSDLDYWGGDACEWGFMINRVGNAEEMAEEDIDVTFRIDRSENCDGSEGGLAIGLRAVTVGGRIVGGLTPYNYTDDVFVPREDEEAVEARFAIFEAVDPADFVNLITDWESYEP